MRNYKWYSPAVPMALSAIVLSGCLSGGGSSSSRDDDDQTAPPEMTREHDDRVFVPVEGEVPALPGLATDRFTGIYEGLQGDAVYSVEIPSQQWNGGLVMYTHGYVGEEEELPVSLPNEAWRTAVLTAGYAWAASSYSANYFDVRAGIEDTNKLALNVMDYIEGDHGPRYDEPQQYLISGFSMGGHIAAAAIDRENRERTLYKVDYAGAAPFCQAEQNQFQWLGDYPRVMMELSGFGDRDYSDFQSLLPQMIGTLFNMNGATPNWSSPRGQEGQWLTDIARNLTGGDRPIFEQGFNSPLQYVVLGTGGSEGDIKGILALNGYGNEDQVYRWTSGDTPTAEEDEFNERIARVSADPDANLPREDGVRWIPLIDGDFDVPVLTMHTLGDFYVPFRHQQLYRERAMENGNEDLLVQRAIRAPSHCDFSGEEIYTAMVQWITWVNGGAKPAGDEVLDADVVANADYGCAFTTPQRPGLPECSN